MTRKYSLVVEGEAGSYSAYVPELPAILITGTTIEELTDRTAEAIRLYWESMRSGFSPTSLLRKSKLNCRFEFITQLRLDASSP